MGHPLGLFARLNDPIKNPSALLHPSRSRTGPCSSFIACVLRSRELSSNWLSAQGRMVPEVRFIGSAGANVDKGRKRPAQANRALGEASSLGKHRIPLTGTC